MIGCGGAGKTTFSQMLGQLLGVEVVHLDALYWRPGWARTPKDEWETIVSDLLRRESWIIDGNYSGTREMRFAACDTIVFLDMPRYVCLYRVIRRFIIYRGRTRPEMAAACNEKMDWEFFEWVWSYRIKRRPGILADLERFREKQVVILRSSREADAFLNGL